jgi:hypothetical protein
MGAAAMIEAAPAKRAARTAESMVQPVGEVVIDEDDSVPFQLQRSDTTSAKPLTQRRLPALDRCQAVEDPGQLWKLFRDGRLLHHDVTRRDGGDRRRRD